MKRRLVVRLHAAKRMIEREISVAEIGEVVETGATIEEYPDDTPFPSRLELGWLGSRPLYVVVADKTDGEYTHIITAYFPDPEKWDEAFKRRKS